MMNSRSELVITRNIRQQ